ncbi:Isochorismatase-like protein [Elsinoe ampelina]|uniref:Isochorismatase-like protein n=1 Tax=Elsinoe ampelina TaxID=302913 RepID=A0A6A6GGY6_9PEZI|nr:Isochorismatase-like protein [Elsinoe ampelina]
MKFETTIALLIGALLTAVSGDAVPWERIDKNNSLLLILDLQVGLYQLARDWDATLYRENIMAHAELGKLFNLPVVLTTSADQGPNGPLPKQMLEMYPDAPLIRRQGEVKKNSAWDNPEFRAAIEASGKKQIIVAGIVTDVCTAFLALSLRAEGYSAFANIEGSGTTTQLIRDTANSRMEKAGVQLVSLFSIVCDLMRDWRNTPGAREVLPFLDKYMPVYGMLARGHAAAVDNGTVIPGEIELITGENGTVVV